MILRVLPLLLFHFFGVDSYASNSGKLVPEGFESWELEAQKEFVSDSLQYYDRGSEKSVALSHLLNDLCKQDNDLAGQSVACERLAFAYSSRGLTALSLEYAMKSYDLARQMEVPTQVIWALYGLVSTEVDLGNYEKALNYAHEALELSMGLSEEEIIRHPKEILISFSYNSEGEVHRGFGFAEKAIESYTAAWEVLEEEDSVDEYTRQTLGHNLGLAYVDLGDLVRGKQYLEDFKMKTPEEWNGLRFFEWQQAYILLHRKQGNPEKALEMIREGTKKAQELEYPKWERAFMELEIQTRSELGQDAMALDLMKKSRELEKNLSGEKVQKQIALLGFQLDLARERDEKLILESQAVNQDWMVGILVVISLLIILLLLFQYRSVLGSRKTNRLLARKNDRMDHLLSEKEMWMNLMAHDLKAPLHLIGGLADMVGNPGVPLESKKSAVANIRKSAEQGTQLISQLLELSNVESGNLAIDFSQVKLNELAIEIQTEMVAAAESKGIDLQLELHPKGLDVKSDPILIRRIVENLISNALKFSPSNSTVQIGVIENGGSPAIFVRDEGPGIPAEEQKQLFQKFVRLSPQPTAGESSTGLGLAIVGLVAEKLGACVEVESQVGKGSTFTLVFGRDRSL